MTTATLRKHRLAPDGPIVQFMKCGQCTSGHHTSCAARIRNGFEIVRADGEEISRTRRFIDCPCCGSKTPPRCLDCGNTNADEIHPVLRECVELAICEGRRELRRHNDPIWQMVQRAKSDAAIRRREIRRLAQARMALVPANEDELLDGQAQERVKRQREPRPPRPQSGECVCCGGATKGGQFLPGHDAKYKSVLRNRVKHNNDQEALKILQGRGWT